MNNTTDLPPDLQILIEGVPDPAAVRQRLARIRQEAVFLRRLLRLAVDADRVREADGHAARHAAQ